MTVKPSSEEIALDSQLFLNKNEVRHPFYLIKKSETKSGKIYISIQCISMWNSLGAYSWAEFLKSAICGIWDNKTNVPAMCTYLPSINAKYSYIVPCNMVTGLWDIGRELLNQTKHSSSFTTSMAMFVLCRLLSEQLLPCAQ